MRKHLAQEKIQEGSEKITAINLPVYKSSSFAREYSNKQWFLVGDAAMGVPYFRALNAGLKCATELAKAVQMHFHPRPRPSNEPIFSKKLGSLVNKTSIEQYNAKTAIIAKKEINHAFLKNMGVNSAISMVKSSQSLPICNVKLDRQLKQQVEDAQIGDHESSSCVLF